MQPVLFSIGNLRVETFGFFLLLAILIGALVVHLETKRSLRRKLGEWSLIDLILFTVFFAGLGGKLFYLVAYYATLQTGAPVTTALSVLFGGGPTFVYEGALLGGILFSNTYLRYKKEPLKDWDDSLGLALLSVYAVASVGLAIGATQTASTAILQTVWAAALFFVIHILRARKNLAAGMILPFAVLGIATARFVLHFWQVEILSWSGLQAAQWLALATIIASGVYLWRLTQKHLLRLEKN